VLSIVAYGIAYSIGGGAGQSVRGQTWVMEIVKVHRESLAFGGLRAWSPGKVWILEALRSHFRLFY